MFSQLKIYSERVATPRMCVLEVVLSNFIEKPYTTTFSCVSRPPIRPTSTKHTSPVFLY